MQQQMPCASGNTHMQAKLLTELQILQTGTDCGFKTAVLLWTQILEQIHGLTFTGNFRIHIPLITISTLILQTTQNSKMHKNYSSSSQPDAESFTVSSLLRANVRNYIFK